ncbi:MAG: ABC transporter substrate-binding protein [Oligoflexia bacterium]|nr:ABC transporter substrate-binding protein [Oligoflexia bacterium]
MLFLNFQKDNIILSFKKMSIFCKSIIYLSTICFPIVIFTTNAISKEISIGLAGNFGEKSSWRISTQNYYIHFEMGIKMVLEDFSSQLKKKNIEIKLVKFDFGGDQLLIPTTAENAVKSDVLAVVGYGYSSEALIAAPLYSQNKLILLTPSATADKLDEYAPFIKRTCFSDSEMIRPIVDRAAKKGIRSVGIISNPDSAYAQNVRNVFIKSFTEKGGTVTADEHILSATSNYSELINKLKNKNFDALFIPNYEESTVFLISALYDSGIRPKLWLGADSWGNGSSLLQKVLAKRDFEAYTISHWDRTSNNIMLKKIQERYQRQFKLAPTDVSILAYDAFKLVILTLLKMKNYSRVDFQKAINSSIKYKGLAGEINLHANQVTPSLKSTYLRRIINRNGVLKTQIL